MNTDSLFVIAKHLARLQGQVVVYNTNTCVFELRPAGWEGDGAEPTRATASPDVGDGQVPDTGCGECPSQDDLGGSQDDGVDRTD